MTRLGDLYDDFTTVGLDSSKWGTAYGNFAITSQGGLRLTPRTGITSYSGVVTSITNFDIYKSYSYARIDSMIGNSTGSEFLYFIKNPTSGRQFMFRFSNGTLTALYKADTATAVVELGSVPYNKASHTWMRFIHSGNGLVSYQTSRDGSSWQTLATRSVTSTTGYQVEFQTGHFDNAHEAAGAVTIGLYNTKAIINRGGGYITENFTSIKPGNITPDTQWGQLWSIYSGDMGTEVEAKLSGALPVLDMDLSFERTGAIRTNLRNKIKDVDIKVNMNLVSMHTLDNSDESARIEWRYLDENNFYALEVSSRVMLLTKRVGGVFSQITLLAVGTKLGVNYRYGISMVGSEMIISRDNGTGNGALVELIRITDTSLSAPGHIALRTYSAHAQFSKFSVYAGVAPVPAVQTLPIKLRQVGAFVDGGTKAVHESMIQNPVHMTNLENTLGRKFDIASWFLGWDKANPFPTANANILAQGRMHLVSWEPVGVKRADLLDGDWDDYIDDFCTEIKKVNGTVALRLMSEMNGNFVPWSPEFNASDYYDPATTCNITNAAQYIEFYRYCVDRVRANGVKNVLWVWCVNEIDEPRNQTNFLEDYYPGDAYCDIMSFDGYNWGLGGPHVWRSHKEVYYAPYNRLAAIHPTKPIWVTETSSKEPEKEDATGVSLVDPSHSKGQWMHDLLSETGFARIEAINLFHIEKERDWRLTSSTTSRVAIQDEFEDASVTLENIVLDPEYNPQVPPAGYKNSAAAGHVEYLKFTEEGYTDLVLTPSYGGLWLMDLDLGGINVREALDVRALGDGARDYTRYLGEKSVSLTMVARPDLHADSSYYVELVSRWLNPTRRPTLVYRLRGQEEQTLQVRGTGFSHPLTMEKRDSVLLNIQLVAVDGKSYSTVEKSVELLASDGAAEAVVTYGSAVTEPTIRIYGPCVNPVVYNDTIESKGKSARLGLTITLEDGQFVEINTKERTVQLNGWSDTSANLRANLTTRDWFAIEPFRSYLRLLTADNNGTATVVWRDAQQ